jgi:hypothetical protein
MTTPHETPEQLLRDVAQLAAQRDWDTGVEYKQLLLECIAAKLARAGYADQVDGL